MLKIKVILAVSFAVSAVFLGLAAAATEVGWLQRSGRPAFIAVVATGSWLTWLVLWLHLRREKRTDERLRRIEDEYRRREAAIMKTFRLLADAPPTGPQPRLYPVASGDGR